MSKELVPTRLESPTLVAKADVRGLTQLVQTPQHLRRTAQAAEEAAGTAGDFGVYLPREDAERVLASVPPESEIGMLLRALWQSGARIDEIRRIKVQDINFAQTTLRLVTLKRGKDKRTGQPKPPEYRLVPVQPDLLGYFARYIAQWSLKPNALIWNWSVRHCNRVVSRAMCAAGVPASLCHPHAWRHGHAIAALSSGRVQLPVLQKNLGHASITTTARYLQYTIRDRIEAYKGVF